LAETLGLAATILSFVFVAAAVFLVSFAVAAFLIATAGFVFLVVTLIVFVEVFGAAFFAFGFAVCLIGGLDFRAETAFGAADVFAESLGAAFLTVGFVARGEISGAVLGF